ncbi:hypothetical protein AYL99_03733 [Fonsecaea erecta]|uniref:Ubiquitin-like domain-containing protein n=1 Tax=Fonsecaea erecta TaxID=1367422 RepID=A0A178ZNZ6_9EURO|nr:hypothetical protein AYL99_03733 [Fonsecaea erecta]OAP61530.1 hypothetical protein AYL99_03733 [Fonsecaea erecta]
MSDLQFAKQFLTSLDNKPNKYQPDHVFDPQTFQMRLPYTLPKLSTPPHPPPPKSVPVTAAAPGSQPSTPTLTLTLKSPRNPNVTLVIHSVPPATATIQDLKEQIQTSLGGPGVVHLDKIKLLLNKKPIPPSKRTVAEALAGLGTGSDVEFGVMVMGGAPDPPQTHITVSLNNETTTSNATLTTTVAGTGGKPTESKKTGGAEGTPMEGVQSATSSVLESQEFWDDLQKFLEQRIGSSNEAGKLRGTFERAWRSAMDRP